MYIIEGYPEFIEDVRTHCRGLIENYNFTLEGNEEDAFLVNEFCKVNFSLNVDQRVIYGITNVKTQQYYGEVGLHLFFHGKLDKIMIGGDQYPLSTEEWIDFYAEDDFHSIVIRELPLICDELEKHWSTILKGDFSFEEKFINWQKTQK